MILNSRGHRLPSADVQRRLKQVHPALGMAWLPSGQWALTYDWPLGDARWAKVQRGEIGDDACYDIWGIAPPTLRDEDAFGFLVNTLRRNSQTREEARQALDRVDAYNRGVSDGRIGEAVDYAEEEFRVHAPTVFAGIGKTIGRVYVTDRRGKRGKAK